MQRDAAAVVIDLEGVFMDVLAKGIKQIKFYLL